MSSEISLLKKCLTKEVNEAIEHLRTSYGGTLSTMIHSGLANPGSRIGVYASDPDAYTTFRPLFDPIIRAYHGLAPGFTQPAINFGKPSDFATDLDPGRKYVLSTRVRCARSIEGFPFNSLLSENQYNQIEQRISTRLTNPSFGFEPGQYRLLASIPDEEKEQLVEEHILFRDAPCDPFLAAANAHRFWPTGRGIFSNQDRSLVVWVNEEDHLRIISMRKDSNIASVVAHLVRALRKLENCIDFVRHPRLGYLTFCPSNIGSTIRASVHMQLPRLGRKQSKLAQLAERYGLQIRGTRGEGSCIEAGVFEFSNKRWCGVSELETIRQLEIGVLNLIDAEEREQRE